MTLLELKAKFVEISGRHDLFDTSSASYPDTGGLFYINAGIRFLNDSILDFSSMRVFKTTGSAAQYTVALDTVTQVYAVSGTEKLILDFVPIENRDSFFEKPLKLVDAENTGKPKYFSHVLSIDQDTNNGEYTAGEDASGLTPVSLSTVSNIILIQPIPDKSYTFFFIGRSSKLELTDSENALSTYWSINYPDLLLAAIMYKLESFFRNTEGARDWLNTLNMGLRAIDLVNAENEAKNLDRLRG